MQKMSVAILWIYKHNSIKLNVSFPFLKKKKIERTYVMQIGICIFLTFLDKITNFILSLVNLLRPSYFFDTNSKLNKTKKMWIKLLFAQWLFWSKNLINVKFMSHSVKFFYLNSTVFSVHSLLEVIFIKENYLFAPWITHRR